MLRIRIRWMDRYVFGSVSQRYRSGSWSGSFYHQAKIVRKTLIPYVLWLLFDFLSLKNDVNAPFKKICFFGVLKVNDKDSRIRIRIHWSEAWIRGSGSTPKCHGSATLLKRPTWAFCGLEYNSLCFELAYFRPKLKKNFIRVFKRCSGKLGKVPKMALCLMHTVHN